MCSTYYLQECLFSKSTELCYFFHRVDNVADYFMSKCHNRNVYVCECVASVAVATFAMCSGNVILGLLHILSGKQLFIRYQQVFVRTI